MTYTKKIKKIAKRKDEAEEGFKVSTGEIIFFEDYKAINQPLISQTIPCL